MSTGFTRQTLPLRPVRPRPERVRRRRRRIVLVGGLLLALFGIGVGLAIWIPVGSRPAAEPSTTKPSAATKPARTDQPSTPPPPFDPNIDAVLPTHRIVAYYAVPGAAATGPAYKPTAAIYARLKAQGAAYGQLDPAHPVALGIDLVVDVPDRFKGSSGTYSHYVNSATISSYVAFCEKYHLLLFLDLNIGWARPLAVLNHFDNYFKLPFVEVAIDPEWMFPRHNGIPGVNLSNVRASDLNPLIEAVAAMPMAYHVPRKVMIIHQYRGDGDGKKNPYNPATAEIADKHNIVNDPRVDLVFHLDSVGGWPGDIALKESQYKNWIAGDMQKYGNFQYGGFKIFYKIESRNKLMTPAQVMAMSPAPMVVTYGN